MPMNIRTIGSNQSEVWTEAARILISYNTPVAAWIKGRGYVRTAIKFSNTTTKHINKWLAFQAATEVQTVPQSELNALV